MQSAPLLLSLLSLLLCLSALCPLVAVAQSPVDPAPVEPPTPLVEVRPGRSVTVIHNIDLVALAGYGPVGREVRVEIVRDGAVVGSTFGPTVNTPDGVGLEINHGPLGEAQPGECWNVTKTKQNTAQRTHQWLSDRADCEERWLPADGDGLPRHASPARDSAASRTDRASLFLSALVPLHVSLPRSALRCRSLRT